MNDQKMYVICIPLSHSPHPPKEQTGCIAEKCPVCKQRMWVSEKKRALREADFENTFVWCGFCIVKHCQAEGHNMAQLPVIDLLQVH